MEINYRASFNFSSRSTLHFNTLSNCGPLFHFTFCTHFGAHEQNFETRLWLKNYTMTVCACHRLQIQWAGRTKSNKKVIFDSLAFKNCIDGKTGSGSRHLKTSERVDIFCGLHISWNLDVKEHFYFTLCRTESTAPRSANVKYKHFTVLKY